MKCLLKVKDFCLKRRSCKLRRTGKLSVLFFIPFFPLSLARAQDYTKHKIKLLDSISIGVSYNTLNPKIYQLRRYRSIIPGSYVNEYGIILQKDLTKKIKLRFGVDITNEYYLIGRSLNYSPFVGASFGFLKYNRFQMNTYIDIGNTNWHYGLSKSGAIYLPFPIIYYIIPGLIFNYKLNSYFNLSSEIDLIGYEFRDYRKIRTKDKWIKNTSFYPHRALSFSINYKF